MIFATLPEGGRDGSLLIVNRARTHGLRAGAVAPTLQALLEDWDRRIEALEALSRELETGNHRDALELTGVTLAAPLPRAYQFLDGSAYPHHMSVIREARGAKMPSDFFDTPLMYQGFADRIIGPTEPIKLVEDAGYGVDIEAEIVVVTGEVPQSVSSNEASTYIRLLGLLNDVSLRNLIPAELARGFGFLQGKSANSMAPFLVTPDEVGALWDGHLLSGRYEVYIRGKLIGQLDPGSDAIFTYPQLIAHACRTRELAAGTIIGAGALANADRKHGCGCIAELRAREQLASGSASTAYLQFGDELRLEMFDAHEKSIFGAIRQRLERWQHAPNAKTTEVLTSRP
jgi:fumarylacetoacetate (FAA) hydrolase